MASRLRRGRLSLLAVTSLATAGGALAAAPAYATTTQNPGPILTDQLTAPGATADANGDLTVTGAALPYTVTVSYTVTENNPLPAAQPAGVDVTCGSAGDNGTLDVVTPFDPATGTGKDTCTFSQAGVHQLDITARDGMGNYTHAYPSVSINQPPPPPPASTAPTLQTTLKPSPDGSGTTDPNGNVTEALPRVGSAAVSAYLSVKPTKGTDGPIEIASATLDCGVAGDIPVQIVFGSLDAQQGMGVGGGTMCYYAKPGTYTITSSATDTQNPAQSSTEKHTVTVLAASAVGVDRYDGASRYGTGVALSQAAFPAPGSAGAVVLARGDVFADALAGIPLAKDKNAPLLLTPGGAGAKGLDPNVENEIVRVLPKDKNHTVYILGGTTAIPQTIADHLGSLGYSVVRLSGASRYETALDIATDPRALDNPGHVVVARGDDFADALAAGPYASNKFTDASGKPAAIVLSDGPGPSAKLDAAGAAYVESKLGTSGNVVAIGGGAQSAVAALPGAGGKFLPLTGQTRYQTAYLVARRGWSTDKGYGPVWNAGIMGVAVGTGFPDALTGGAYMALKDGPLLLADPAPYANGGQFATIPMVMDLNLLKDVAMFGGTGVLSTGIQQAILTAVKSPASAYVDHHRMF